MGSVCLPSDALLQHLPCYLGFSYLGCGVSLHSCSSKAQPLLLTLDEGYSSPPRFLTFRWDSSSSPSCTRAATTPWAWGCSFRPPPWPLMPPLASDVGWLLSAATSGLRHGLAPPGRRPWPRAQGISSWPQTWGSSSLPHFCKVPRSQCTSK